MMSTGRSSATFVSVTAVVWALSMAIGAAVVTDGSTAEAATPMQECSSDKQNASGKYVNCLQTARKVFVAKYGLVKYEKAVAKCLSRYVSSIQKAEAAVGPGGCADEGTMATYAALLRDVCHYAAAQGLNGSTIVADESECSSAAISCSADLSTCRSSQQVPLLRTGQTTCHGPAGWTDPIPCAGTGQDGEILAGASLSYADNGDGTITDLNSNLMWEKPSFDGSIHDQHNTYYWPDAFLRIQTLNNMAFAGHDDWRLPNITELATLIDFGRDPFAFDPIFRVDCVEGCSNVECSCLLPSVYFSSTKVDDNTENVWVAGGGVIGNLAVTKENEMRAIAVRSAP